MVVTTSQAKKNPVVALLSNLTWETLEKLDADLAETGAQLTYLDGCLEIMTPLSDAHEEPKNTLGQLLEIYMRVKNIRFYGRGSTTIGTKELGARKEPDESYCLGTRKPVPDLAIEIIVTSGGIDTLEIYRRVGVSEVWFWQDGVISVYCLRSTGYDLVSKSELLPELDLRSLEFYSRMADQYDAVNDFMRSLI
ncbi:Uma2 family endonuclease [Dolichospermum circinale CS-1225]|uniref:Uma2 family endonuclease n=1 Tax=Dolichospermum circinale CS-537/01 TaxID=3021739 RepID=A0ABT5A7J2_9CYAN|nr:Uma2 family endonuclease [Dolichospermum circinale]MDB9460738.1 Uma2 family endonuclease [Dolichospermum circinale CS-545/17]MDB9465718.1 Uma2 family endonuclease [Dolichospermum circinale CS-539/09]MDB9470015.1 Uma2 family endonuclease [Dolichospermum circinale CS-539]MDB9487923.1 Uma2 family endonuclease [Dolichospermum circinale CS-537/01]MDB9523790.1 Uma2 family endonuclease [Dolichospermum circinale CS-1225]